MTKTIVLIHGAWLSPASWDLFAEGYRALGYEVLQPTWPHEELSASGRFTQDPAFAGNSITQIVDWHEALIRSRPEPPILVGHSFGGLFVQMLLDRGLGAAGVAIDPAPAKGVPPSLSALIGALPVFLAWQGWKRTLAMSFRQFSNGFMHLSSSDDQVAAYHRWVVGAPGRIYYQSAFGTDGRVNFANPDRAPLLLITGEKDRTVARSTVEMTYRKYRESSAITDLHVFPGRTHMLIATPGWEEIADYAIDWVSEQVGRPVTKPRLAAGF